MLISLWARTITLMVSNNFSVNLGSRNISLIGSCHWCSCSSEFHAEEKMRPGFPEEIRTVTVPFYLAVPN